MKGCEAFFAFPCAVPPTAAAALPALSTSAHAVNVAMKEHPAGARGGTRTSSAKKEGEAHPPPPATVRRVRREPFHWASSHDATESHHSLPHHHSHASCWAYLPRPRRCSTLTERRGRASPSERAPRIAFPFSADSGAAERSAEILVHALNIFRHEMFTPVFAISHGVRPISPGGARKARAAPLSPRP